MSACRFYVWGSVRFDAMDGPERLDYVDEIRRELRPYGLVLEIENGGWTLRTFRSITPGERLYRAMFLHDVLKMAVDIMDRTDADRTRRQLPSLCSVGDGGYSVTELGAVECSKTVDP